MEPNDVIERYDKKEVRKQVDQMDEEEVSDLAEQVAALASTIEDPSDAIAKRVVAFFEQEKIFPEVRILGIRTLTSNMAGKLVSEKLANLLSKDIDNVPQDFWENDTVNDGIRAIDVCNDFKRLLVYVTGASSERARKAAALKAARIATTDEEKKQLQLATEKW